MNFLFIKDKTSFPADALAKVTEKLNTIWGKTVQIESGETVFICEERMRSKSLVPATALGAFGYISGVVRSRKLPKKDKLKSHNEKFIDQLTENESEIFNPEWTGCFSALAYSKNKGTVHLASDIIGSFQLYYTRSCSHFVASNSMIAMNFLLGFSVDLVGLLQILSPPDYCYFGKKTCVKGIFRILPGETIRVSSSSIEQTSPDSSLYDPKVVTDIKETAEVTWNVIKEDTELLLRFDETIHIAMSGGLDSRLVLASIPDGKKIKCHTYGLTEYFETNVARKCAESIGAEFTTHDVRPHTHPSRNILEKYLLKTESIHVSHWFSVAENSDISDELLLMGDMTDALSTRNIKTHSSRNSRISNYLKYMITGRSIKFERANSANFSKWENAKIKSIRESAHSMIKLIPFIEASTDDLLDELLEEVLISTKRVKTHNLDYAELYDELFQVYHHGSQGMGRQFRFMNSCYQSLSPNMSVRQMKYLFSVNPSLRMYHRLFSEIAKLFENRNLSRICTSHTISRKVCDYGSKVEIQIDFDFDEDLDLDNE